MILAAITALAAVLRVWQINESLWVDELHTSWCLQAGLENVAQRAAEGNHSPLYLWLLWGVTRVLGESEFTLRLPSLLAGISLPGMAWLVVRRLDLGERTLLTAILAALLVAVDHTSIFYATEARPYALVELASAGALILALESLRGGILPRAALVVALALMFYLHYTTALYLGGLIVSFLVYSVIAKDARHGDWKVWLVIGGITFVCCLPATSQLLDIASRRANWTSFARDFAAGREFIPLIVLLALWSPLPPRRVLLAAAVCLLPALLAAGLTWWEIAPVFLTRYIVATIPLLYVSIAAASQIAEQPRVRWVASMVAFAVAIWWSGIAENCVNYGRPLVVRQEDWRSAITAANKEHEQHRGWKVLVYSGLIETDALREHPTPSLRNYGLLPVRAIYQLDAPDEALIPLPMTEPERLTEQTRDALLKAGGAIVILRLSAEKAEPLAQELDNFGIIKKQSFGNVQVITFEVSIAP
jgi:hypothetical protein